MGFLLGFFLGDILNGAGGCVRCGVLNYYGSTGRPGSLLCPWLRAPEALLAREKPFLARESPALHAWTSRAKHVITRDRGVIQPWLPAAACHHVEVLPVLTRASHVVSTLIMRQRLIRGCTTGHHVLAYFFHFSPRVIAG